MTNPFTPSFGTTPPVLVGRTEVLDSFEDSLATGPGDPGRAVLLTGVRGSGKTVLLNALEAEARRRGWAVLSQTTRPGVAAEMVSTDLPALLSKLAADTSSTTITGGNVSALGIGGGFTRQRTARYPVQPSLRSELTALADAQSDKDAGVLVSLDEVHREATADLREIAQAVQHLFREGREVAFVAAGLPAAVDDLLNDAVLTFLRRAERFHLGPVPPADADRAIREPIEMAGRHITDDALHTAATAAQGYPFLVQLIGFQTWAVDPDTDLIDNQQATTGVRRAVRRVGRLVHEPALASLSAVDRSFLEAMAVDDGVSRMADIRRRLGVDENYASQYRLRLIAAELIRPAGYGRVAFAVPYLSDYLRTARPTTDQP